MSIKLNGEAVSTDPVQLNPPVPLDPNYELYTSTPQLQQFVRHDTCLVLGAKGTGKSFLRRMCLEQLELLTRRSGVKALRDIRFVDGFSNPHHGRHSQPPITQELLREFEKKGEDRRPAWPSRCVPRSSSWSMPAAAPRCKGPQPS